MRREMKRLLVLAAGLLAATGGSGYAGPDAIAPSHVERGAKAPERERGEPYVLGPEDSVAIRVVGHEEFSGTAVVRPDGRISAPGLGELPAAGRSADAVREEVAARLKRWVRDPNVTVTVTQFRSQGQVFVMGQVARPNAYPYRPGLTLSEALALAGGATADADLTKATLFRAGEGEGSVRVDLSHFARDGETAPGVALSPGDLVLLPLSRPPRVSVLGDVQKPGQYLVTEKARVLEAIQLAEGPRSSANLKAATLTRGGAVTPIDLETLLRRGDTALNLALEDGDSIFVPENQLKVYVLGEVAKPDLFVLREGATVLDALAAAGGHTRDADLKKVRVGRRDAAGQPRVETLDLTRLVAEGTASGGRPKATLPLPLAEGDLLFVPSRTRKKSVTDYIPFLYPVELLGRMLGG